MEGNSEREKGNWGVVVGVGGMSALGTKRHTAPLMICDVAVTKCKRNPLIFCRKAVSVFYDGEIN